MSIGKKSSRKRPNGPRREIREELGTLLRGTSPPPLFEEGDGPIWSDPYISQQILQAHLDRETDAASRRPESIDASLTFLLEQISSPGRMRILDLGCGPGLYAERLARMGHEVVGVDLSPLALEHARRSAREQDLGIRYLRQDYRHLRVPGQFDLVLMIYGGLGTLSPEERDRLLGRINRKLRPGGHFFFDVMTPHNRSSMVTRSSWYTKECGFWRPTPHLVLEEAFDFEREGVVLERYLVLDSDGRVGDYRVWTQLYTVPQMEKLLASQGLELLGCWADVQGTAYHEEAPWLGMLARKP